MKVFHYLLLSQVFNGWSLTCERLGVLKTRRQAPEVEDIPTTTTHPVQHINPVPTTHVTERVFTTSVSTIQSEVDRFRVLEEVCC